jgi:hypothetical protein
VQNEIQLRVQSHPMVVKNRIPEPHSVSSAIGVGNHRNAECDTKDEYNRLRSIQLRLKDF